MLFDSIEGTVKEGNRSIVFVYLVYVSVQLGLDGCGVGSSAVIDSEAQRSLTCSERRERFETYQVCVRFVCVIRSPVSPECV